MLRRTYLFSLLIIIYFIFSGCRTIQHEVNTTYQTDIYATEITLKTDGYLFGGTGILDPGLNEDTDNWEIVKIELNAATLGITEASSVDMLFAYQMQLIITDNTTGKSITHSLDGINSLHPDNTFDFPLTPHNIIFLKSLLQNKHTATIEINGYSSQSGIEITFDFTINALVGLR